MEDPSHKGIDLDIQLENQIKEEASWGQENKMVTGEQKKKNISSEGQDQVDDFNVGD